MKFEFVKFEFKAIRLCFKLEFGKLEIDKLEFHKKKKKMSHN